MPFEIVRNDITNMQVDVIVNGANPLPIVGYGVDTAVHQKAGAKLLTARKSIGEIAFGDAAITPAYDLDAQYVIHAVSPFWEGGSNDEAALLEKCYAKVLALAHEHNCESIAFPLLSAGNHGFPKDIALQIAINSFSKFLMQHDMQIYLVVFSRNAYSLSEKLFSSVQSFIDEAYIQQKSMEEYGVEDKSQVYDLERLQLMEARRQLAQKAPLESLEHFIARQDETFSEGLLRLIDEKGFTDPEIYKRANVDRKLFSKIRNNTEYKPSKTTSLAFAIALELDIDETQNFIGRAGYALTHSSKFDLIIEYFLRHKIYDIFEINKVLFAFEQPLIGC